MPEAKNIEEYQPKLPSAPVIAIFFVWLASLFGVLWTLVEKGTL